MHYLIRGKMLVQGEFDLNSVQMYSGPFKDVLKQTMLSQEVMFKKQVLELHRLYAVQKLLMQKFGFKEFDRCSLKKAGTKPNFLACTNTERYDPWVKETEVSSISTLEERLAMNHKLQNRPVDLQLPADQYISIVGIDLEEINLSLNIGIRCRETASAGESFLYKKSRILSEEVIDLEDSIDGGAENVPSNFNSPTVKCTGYLDLNEAQHDDSSCHSNDPVTTNYSTSSSSPAFKGMMFGKGKLANCSSPVLVREKYNCFIESTTLEQDANLEFMDSGSRNERMEIHSTQSKFKGTNASEMDIQFDEGPVGTKVNFPNDFKNCGDDESAKSEAGIERSGIITNDKNCAPNVSRHARLQKNEECSNFSRITNDGCDSILTESTCIAEDEAIGVKNVKHLSLQSSNRCYKIDEGLHVTETIFSPEQEHGSSDSIESEHSEGSSELKLLIRNAAESLICMSLAGSICVHDFGTNIESNDMARDQVEQPSDSFELLVLKQTENNEDEHSISSKSTEVYDMEKKDFSFKLRRGRRLKDFQKEILPGLSSLSRHEICEDINILEAVLRSREYRRIRAKMPNEHKWFAAPLKSKRSRLNNVRRRIIL